MQLESQQKATKQHPLSSVSSPLPRSRSRLTTHTTPHWAHGCTIQREETYESWWWRNGHGAYDCSTQDLNVVDGHDFLSHENFLDTPLDVYFVKRCTLDSSRLCSASAWQPANISLSKRDKWKLDKIHEPSPHLLALAWSWRDVMWCDSLTCFDLLDHLNMCWTVRRSTWYVMVTSVAAWKDVIGLHGGGV